MNKKFLITCSAIVIVTLAAVTLSFITREKLNSNPSNNTVVLDSKKPSTNEVSVESLSKEDVHLKMLNASNSFDNVKGSVKVDEKSRNIGYTVDFELKKGSKNKSYEKSTDITGEVRETICTGDEIITFDDTNKTFMVAGCSQGVDNNQLKLEKPKDWYQKAEDGEKLYMYKSSPFNISSSRICLDPQEIAVGFLENYDQWDFKKGDSYLGLNTILIEGTFNNYYNTKFKADKFQITIDSKTGVMLKLRKYNSSTNEDTGIVQVTNLDFNPNINDADFIKDRTGYKENKI